MSVQHYDQSDDLTDVFVGRRIVSVQKPAEAPQVQNRYGGSLAGFGSGDLGLLTLDDGTKVYAIGNEGGCACLAGCYDLTKLAATDNIITSVKVVEPSDDTYGERSGTYSIFVITEAAELNVAEFEGDDGNGYYGTGFHLAVIPADQTADDDAEDAEWNAAIR